MAGITRRPKNVAKLNLEQNILMFEEHFEYESVTLSAIEARTAINEIVEFYKTYQELSSIYGEHLQLWSDVDNYARLQHECKLMEERYAEFMCMAEAKVYELENLYQRHKPCNQNPERERIRLSLFTQSDRTPPRTVSQLGDTNPFKADLERELRIKELEHELTDLRVKEESAKRSRYATQDVFNVFKNVGRRKNIETPSDSFNSSQELLLPMESDARTELKLIQHVPPPFYPPSPMIPASYASYKSQQKSQLNPTSTPFEPGVPAHVDRKWEPSTIQQNDDVLSRCSSYTEYREFTRRDKETIENREKTVQTQTSISNEIGSESSVMDYPSVPSFGDRNTPSVFRENIPWERVPDISNITAFQGTQTYLRELDSTSYKEPIHTPNTQQERSSFQPLLTPIEGPSEPFEPLYVPPRYNEMASSPVHELHVQQRDAGLQTSFSSYQEFRDEQEHKRLGLNTPSVQSYTHAGIVEGSQQYSGTQMPGGVTHPSVNITTGMSQPPVIPAFVSQVQHPQVGQTQTNITGASVPNALPPSVPVQPTIIGCGHSCNTDRGGRMDRYLHKIKVPEFAGDPRKFPGWWSVILEP